MYCSRRARIVRAPLRALFAVACDARHRERRVSPRIRASLHCALVCVRLDARRTRAVDVASAAGCRPNGAPCGAASVRRKKPARVARRMRASLLSAHGCAVSEPPEHARAVGGQDARRPRHRGCVSLVTFFAQAKKVTRSPQASGSIALSETKQRARNWILAFAGMTIYGRKVPARPQGEWKLCREERSAEQEPGFQLSLE